MSKASLRLRPARGEAESVGWLAGRCSAGLSALFSVAEPGPGMSREQALAGCVRHVVRLLAVMSAAERIPPDRFPSGPLRAAAGLIRGAVLDGGVHALGGLDHHLRAAYDASGIGLLLPDSSVEVTDEGLSAAAGAILAPGPDAPIDPLFFQSMPASWLGYVYQALLGFRTDEPGPGIVPCRADRKRRGIYFTPPSLVGYIVESVLAMLASSSEGQLGPRRGSERSAGFTILDPAMGGGDFLARAVDAMCGSDASDDAQRARVAAECVYGVDIDPVAVEIARFSVWAASGYADGIAEDLEAHLVCGDAIGAGAEASGFDWSRAFPEVFRAGGFDAVVGNPPYIASKNGFGAIGSKPASRGQSDSYLLFTREILDGELVRPGGAFSMVLPDPMLVRENAAEVRRRLLSDWSLESLLHILGAFPEAEVANVVPVCRKTSSAGDTFQACRIERVADRRAFVQQSRRTALALSRPVRTATALAQPRCELLYLLEDGAFGPIIRRIHGDRVSLSEFKAPFVPLRDLNVKRIYRGEEVGKSAINQDSGEMPMLMGGQSVQPYEIRWEGRKTDLARLRKSPDRYQATKILVQKSSARLIAALDQPQRRHPGYAFPQSVYGIELRQPGMHELYLLCILNSEVMSEYIRRTVTGYKMLQPQLEIEDIRALPIRRVNFTTPAPERQAELSKAVRIFEDESLRSVESVPFAELGNFAGHCLTGNPERSDVVHDLLVHLGHLVMDLTKAGRLQPDPETTRRLESARAAVEAVVWRLYSSEPAQMSLQF